MKTFKIPLGKGKFRWVHLFREGNDEVVVITSHSLEKYTPEQIQNELNVALAINREDGCVAHTTNQLFSDVQTSLLLKDGYVLDILQGTMYLHLNGSVFYLNLLVPDLRFTYLKLAQATLEKFGHTSKINSYPEGGVVLLDGFEPDDTIPAAKPVVNELAEFEEQIKASFSLQLRKQNYTDALVIVSVWEKFKSVQALSKGN